MTVNIDAEQRNADWVKFRTWEFPTEPELFLYVIGGREKLAYFMTLPASKTMPSELRTALFAKAHTLGLAHAKEWNEEDHPRDDIGRFGEGGGGADRPSGILAVPTEIGDLNEPSREKWAFEMERYGVKIEDLEAEIRSRIDVAAVEHAAAWYPAAHDLAVDISTKTGIELDRVAAALSACSGRVEWQNPESGEGEVKYVTDMAQFVAEGKAAGLTGEEAVLAWKAEYKETNDVLAFDSNHERTGEPVGASIMNSFAEKGMDILTGSKSIEDALPENKQRSFFDNIMQPGATNEATIDTHMFKTLENVYGVSFADATKFAGLDRTSVKNDIDVNGVGYIAICEAVRSVADEYGVAPDVVQAAYWEQVQNTIEHIEMPDGKPWPGGVPRTEPKP